MQKTGSNFFGRCFSMRARRYTFALVSNAAPNGIPRWIFSGDFKRKCISNIKSTYYDNEQLTMYHKRINREEV